MPDTTLSFLERAAQAHAAASHVPYSGRAEAAVVMDASGRWVPGVRVENASFSLTLPALRNALTTAVALGLGPLVAAVTTAPLSPSDEAELAAAAPSLARATSSAWRSAAPLPAPAPEPVAPFLDAAVATPDDGLRVARALTEKALVPESRFPVGCAAVLPDGRVVPGVNVERAAWPAIVCAERNALGTLVSYALGTPASLYVVCARAACSPCGACRQVIAELAPEAEIWMLRDALPLASTAAELLPGYFHGRALDR